jgi:hypothetical protein
MLAPRFDNMQPYQVVVYHDGQAIVELAHTLQLTGAELDDLVSRLAGDLRGQPSSVTPRGGLRVMDAGATELGVRTASGTLTVRADALDEMRQFDAYPAALYTARDLLGSLADRVRRDGSAYRSGRIRLFAQPAGGEPFDAVGRWPSGVPVPTTVDGYGVRHVDLAGGQAQTLMRTLTPQQVNWSPVRTPSNELLLISWRYLLPDE